MHYSNPHRSGLLIIILQTKKIGIQIFIVELLYHKLKTKTKERQSIKISVLGICPVLYLSALIYFPAELD